MRGHQVVGCAWNDVQATVGNPVPTGIEHVDDNERMGLSDRRL